MVCAVVWAFSRSKYRGNRIYYDNYCYYDYDVDLCGNIDLNKYRDIPYLSMRDSFGISNDFTNSNFEFMNHECLYQG